MIPQWLKKKKTSKVKRRVNLVSKLDRVFSLYIRLRDIMPNGYGRCISCGQIKHFSDLDCGHFWGRTKMAVRFDEDNCNAECKYCNRMDSSHLIGYRDNLVAKIGRQRYDALYVKAKSTKHWLDFELQEMIDKYTAEVKRLSKSKGVDVSI